MKPTLYALCGFVGSGKSTFADKLARDNSSFVFSIDQWMLSIFGDTLNRSELLTKQRKLHSLFYESSLKLLSLNQSIILDSGLWKHSERMELRESASNDNIPLEIYYLDVPFEVCRGRVLARNYNNDQNNYHITDEVLEMFWTEFEPPGKDEHVIRIHSSSLRPEKLDD